MNPRCGLVLLLVAAGFVNLAPVQAQDASEPPPRTVRQVSLYSDAKAHSVGDILTVAIVERASASNRERVTSQRSTQTETSGEVGTGLFSFLPEFGMRAESNRTHDGGGQTSREDRLTARMAVTVQEVRANGDLVISGQRQIKINDETEELTLTGVVRPSDIAPGNIVYSTDIADAQISYQTKGRIKKESRPNIFMRILGWFF